ncbi:MAG: fused response regulator/phosphatase [Myxococcales bacterium]|nr:MAG: fused response regulator/phosphatase [Myxococcales bacterium]
MRILIAEDDAILRRMLETYVQRWGYTSRATKDGAEAWAAYQTEDFDIVITDWMMPDVDGVELCRRIRSRPKARYTYIIILTSLDSKDALAMGIQRGADDYIVKPLEPAELRARLTAGERILHLERSLSESNAIMKRELENAARTLASLLPARKDIAQGVSLDWHFRPSIYIGGDFFNVLKLDDEHLAFYMIDVTGHGVSSALLAVMISNVLRTSAVHGGILKYADLPGAEHIVPPGEVASTLNARFPMDPESGMHFTLFYAVLNIRTRELRYVKAGHPHPLRLSSEGLSFLDKGSPPIGIIDGYAYPTHAQTLRPRDLLLVYSDGLLDSLDRQGSAFGGERLVRLAKCHRQAGPAALVSEISADFEQFKDGEAPDDDITMLALQVD